MFIYGPGTRVSVVVRIRSPLFLLGGYGFYLIIALYLMVYCSGVNLSLSACSNVVHY